MQRQRAEQNKAAMVARKKTGRIIEREGEKGRILDEEGKWRGLGTHWSLLCNHPLVQLLLPQASPTPVPAQIFVPVLIPPSPVSAPLLALSTPIPPAAVPLPPDASLILQLEIVAAFPPQEINIYPQEE